MTEALDNLRESFQRLTPAQRQEFTKWARSQLSRHPLEARWGVGAEVILDAIERSSDLTRRGIRGVIAKAVFETVVLPLLVGWHGKSVDDRSYDFLLESGTAQARVQVKLQRLERGKPKHAAKPYPREMYVVEVQRTRSGTDRRTGKGTRPYSFDDFDIARGKSTSLHGRLEEFLVHARSLAGPATRYQAPDCDFPAGSSAINRTSDQRH